MLNDARNICLCNFIYYYRFNSLFRLSKWKDKSMKIAIVGAGISGLTTAYYLEKFGFDVDVFEKEKVGGKANTIKKDNFLFEEGVNGFLDNSPETIELCNEIKVPMVRAIKTLK